MEDKKQDLQIDGPYSPISLRKLIEQNIIREDGKVKVLLDQSNVGFSVDCAPVQQIAFEDCKLNATYYRNNYHVKLNGKFPVYIIRHYIFMYHNEHRDLVYPFKDFDPKKLNDFLQQDEKGKQIVEELNAKIKWMHTNIDFMHLFGMIICVYNCLKIAKEMNKGCRLWIDKPEQHMHPQQERLFMSMLNDMYIEFTGTEID